MPEEIQTRIRQALLFAWSPSTSEIFNAAMHPSYGQCAQTAIVIQERFGGEILKTRGWPPTGRHFYNLIDGTRIDFTADQFTSNTDYCLDIKYDDLPSDAIEAETETTGSQIAALRRAFELAFDENRNQNA